MPIMNPKAMMKRIELNMDRKSVIVNNGLRVRGDSYKLTDGKQIVNTKYIGFQDLYEKHGFLEECKKWYKIYLVNGATGTGYQIHADKTEMKYPLLISKELKKYLGDFK